MNSNHKIHPSWIKSFNDNCLKDIAKKYQHNVHEHIEEFQKECIFYMQEIYGVNRVDFVKKTLNFNITTELTDEISTYDVIHSLLMFVEPFRLEDEKDEPCMELVRELQKYGLYKNFDLKVIKKNRPKYYLSEFTIEKLTKELEENRTAESDSQKILNDDYVVNVILRNPKYRGPVINPEKQTGVNVTNAAIRLIQPELERRWWEMQITQEAKRRLAQQKWFKEQEERKQKFEDEVKRKMEELEKTES